MAFTSFNHTLLGPILGIQTTPLVTQFRSIPYATFPERFRQSVLKTSLGSGERNFTEYGYACPQLPTDMSTTGGDLPGQQPWKFSEDKCLTVTVTVPSGTLEEREKERKEKEKGKKKKGLPVLVYIHGGGFTSGLGSVSPLFDNSLNTQLSVKEKEPVIYVNIAYRLGWFGTLASQDLLDDAALHDAPPGNFGLYDQRNALLWIQQFISGFGGDPSRVTVFGESAGSISIHYHMMSNTSVPLFSRAAMLSGTAQTLLPLPLAAKERSYLTALSAFNISATDPLRLEKLRKVPEDQLVAAQVPHLSFWADGAFNHPSFFKQEVTYGNAQELVRDCAWVEEIIIGNTGEELCLYVDIVKMLTLNGLVRFFRGALGGNEVGLRRVLDVYGISEGMDTNLFWTRALQLLGDFFITASTHQTALTISAKKPVYRYSFDVVNPFLGSEVSHASHHALDTYYLFQTLQFRMPTQVDKDVSTEFARRLNAFANGRKPWARFEKRSGEKIAVATSSWERWTERERREDEKKAMTGGRRYLGWEVLNEEMAKVAGWVDLDAFFMEMFMP